MLSSEAATELFNFALTCCSTSRRLSKRRAADEPGLFLWRFAYSLSQYSSSFFSLSGPLEVFSVSEVFPEEAAKVNSTGGRAAVVADTVSATTGDQTVVKGILAGISTTSIADRLRPMLVPVDAVDTFNMQSRLLIAPKLTPSDDKEREEAGTVMAIVLDAIGPCVSIYI